MSKDRKRPGDGPLTSCVLLTGIICLLFAFPSSSVGQANPAKSQRPSRVEDLLLRAGVVVDVQPPAKNQYSLDVPVQWNAYVTDDLHIRPANAPTTPGGGFVINQGQVRRIPELFVAPRASEVSTDQLLVATVDSRRQLRGWALVTDPRILRQEGPAPNGELKGEVLHRTKVEFIITIPDDASIAELRFYKPVRSGEEFNLLLLGTSPFRQPVR